jgi:hypothetical protein
LPVLWILPTAKQLVVNESICRKMLNWVRTWNFLIKKQIWLTSKTKSQHFFNHLYWSKNVTAKLVLNATIKSLTKVELWTWAERKHHYLSCCDNFMWKKRTFCGKQSNGN